MSDAVPEKQVVSSPKAFLPVCPFCGLDPCIPEAIECKHGNIKTVIFACSNPECRKIFNAEAVGYAQPEEKPRIHTPG